MTTPHPPRRRAKQRRLELKLVRYSEAERLLRAGWMIAPEEDQNAAIGLVYVERLESVA